MSHVRKENIGVYRLTCYSTVYRASALFYFTHKVEAEEDEDEDEGDNNDNGGD